MLVHDRYCRCLKPMWHGKTFSLWKSFSFTPGEALAVLRVPRHKLVFLGGFATLHFSRARGTAVLRLLGEPCFLWKTCSAGEGKCFPNSHRRGPLSGAGKAP